jgi:hypothetical protein
VASLSQSSEQTTASSAVSVGKVDSRGPVPGARSSLSRAVVAGVRVKSSLGFDLQDRKSGTRVRPVPEVFDLQDRKASEFQGASAVSSQVRSEVRK